MNNHLCQLCSKYFNKTLISVLLHMCVHVCLNVCSATASLGGVDFVNDTSKTAFTVMSVCMHD